MSENKVSLEDVKSAWLDYQNVRDAFEAQTFELRKRYVRFMTENFFVPKGYQWKINPALHLDVLNPEDFDNDLRFIDKDSIFGVEFHTFPPAYLDDPDKWEAERLAQVHKDKAIAARRELRMKSARMRYMEEELHTTLAEPHRYSKDYDNIHSEEWQSYIQEVKGLIIRELTESGGRSTQPEIVRMLSLAYHVHEDHALIALVMAEQSREVRSYDNWFCLPEEHPDYEYPEDNSDD